MKVRANVDYNQNQLLFPVAHVLSTAPSGAVQGQFYYDTGKSVIYVYNGSSWIASGMVTHTHLISDVINLQTTLDNKTPYGHTHYLSDILDFEGTFSLVNHTHEISQVNGLQSVLDSKASAAHSHSISAITGLQTALDGKSANGHGHAIGDVTGLQTALDGKSDTSHGHAISAITGLQTALDAKAAASHSHAISDTTNLQNTLDLKVPKSGATMGGALVAAAHGTITNWEIVNVAYGTSATPPSSASEGCVYIQYT